MRRFLLYLITVLLTFSVGSFIHMYVDRASYNMDVAAREGMKRKKAEIPEARYGRYNGRLIFLKK